MLFETINYLAMSIVGVKYKASINSRMLNITRLLLIGCLLISTSFQFTNGFQTANIPDELTLDCSICPTMELVSEGGFADMYPRYLGTWLRVEDYHGLPMYMCIVDCQGLSDKLVIF